MVTGEWRAAMAINIQETGSTGKSMVSGRKTGVMETRILDTTYLGVKMAEENSFGQMGEFMKDSS